MDVGEDRTAEAHAHALLVEHEVPVPYILRYDLFAPEDGRAAMLTGEMPGHWQGAVTNLSVPE